MNEKLPNKELWQTPSKEIVPATVPSRVACAGVVSTHSEDLLLQGLLEENQS